MRSALLLLISLVLLSLTSCRKDFETVPSNGTLTFSKDTIYLDTVFTNIGSSTYRLKVYNNSGKDITIPTIRMGKSDSKYRMMVDGLTGQDENGDGIGEGKLFTNVELLANDSLFVFIETTVDIAQYAAQNQTQFLYTDEILFDGGSNLQKVNLVTLIQDAIFLYPKKFADGSKESLLLGIDETGAEVRVNGFELDENDPNHGNEFQFTNQKPYVVYGYAGIPNNKTLTIDAGARVHFHAESGLIAQPGSSLQINGAPSLDPANPLANEVIFEGDRLEPGFADVPGQWGTIWLRPSSNSFINHATIKNATVGLLVENSNLLLDNSQIYNNTNVGILARNAIIKSINTVINYAGQACLAAVGGSYDFTHATINNNWSSTRQLAVSLSNYQENSDQSLSFAPLTHAEFKNSIIYSQNAIGLLLDKAPDHNEIAFESNFQHCLIKFRDAGTVLSTNENYNFIRLEQNGNLKNQDPKFFDPYTNQLNIDSSSGAYQKGNLLYLIGFDIRGNARSTVTAPDLGAYIAADFPN
ncbi:MAG: hypothetical protein NTX74_06515 [Flavobacterium sp.]|nr:hypothetical protein [Flavobacterium sp.]